MVSSPVWRDVLGELETQGVQARVVPVERLDEVGRRAGEAMAEAGFAGDVVARIDADFTTGLPAMSRPARSAVIAAVARPLTLANLTWHGERRAIPVPPHYAGYHAVPRAIAQKVDELLRPAGFGAAFHEPPLKTLATCARLARYGRNNVAYVSGLGSWLQLGACVSDAPPPDDAEWGEPQVLDRCERCSACLRACPTGAIAGDRFVLHTDRCLTWHNESDDPFPDWLDPAAHHCAVGCLRCQLVCPENVHVDLVQAAPEWFDEEETAAILAAEDLAAEGGDSETGSAAGNAHDEWAGLSVATREKLARCGLDYSPRVIARNIRVLLSA
jgi:epoxyqueuosine reductase